MHVGHALLGDGGEMLSLDEGFCTILRTDANAILGLGILDVTVPSDRATCRDLMRRLRATREPFQVAKRFQCGDGSTIRVSNTVSVLQFDDRPAMILSTIIPIEPPAEDATPAAMLEIARFMIAARRERGAIFGTSIFSDPAWDMILAAYIVEAEARLLDIDMLALVADTPVEVTRRWVRALVQEKLIELEEGRQTFRLTSRAQARCETYLARMLSTGPAERGVPGR